MIDIENYVPRSNLLENRVILVSGAGQGLGRMAALTYAAYGATVILHGRKQEKLESIYDEIEASGGVQPTIFPLDLETAGDKDFAVMAQAIRLQLGRLDGILHSAAWLPGLTPLENQTSAQWLTVLQVNLIAAAGLTRACLPLLKAAPDASVVMTSDTHGHHPAAYWGGFSVAKAGIEALVRIQAQEWELLPGLRINALIPGPVNTSQQSKTHPGQSRSRLVQPAQLMGTYLYLMGQDSKGLSGNVIFCQK
jgi:NAD(P)-dependent dehydrogenase (short-subunit alcohol dehydrogenase family)